MLATAPDVSVGSGDAEVDIGGEAVGILPAVSAAVGGITGPSVDAGTEGRVPSIGGEVPTGTVDVSGEHRCMI